MRTDYFDAVWQPVASAIAYPTRVVITLDTNDTEGVWRVESVVPDLPILRFTDTRGAYPLVAGGRYLHRHDRPLRLYCEITPTDAYTVRFRKPDGATVDWSIGGLSVPTGPAYPSASIALAYSYGNLAGWLLELPLGGSQPTEGFVFSVPRGSIYSETVSMRNDYRYELRLDREQSLLTVRVVDANNNPVGTVDSHSVWVILKTHYR